MRLAGSLLLGCGNHGCRCGARLRWCGWFSRLPDASEREIKSKVAHTWADWLHHPCGPGRRQHSERGTNQKWPTSGWIGDITPAFWGSQTLHGGGQNQKWPTCVRIGYMPNASERGTKSEVAHKWADWLHHPYRLGLLNAYGRGQNQKWPTCGMIGYITPAVRGVPNASQRGTKSKVAHKWARWLHHTCRLGGAQRFTAGTESEVAHNWADWPHHPCHPEAPQRFRAGDKIRCGPHVG